jgi:hypothetical protein
MYTLFLTTTSLSILGFIIYKYRKSISLLYQIFNSLEVSSNNEISFTICDTDACAILKYQRSTVPYNLYLPYNRSQVLYMSQFLVELLREQKPPLVLTQQPGIPYLITARALGGTHIRITNMDTGIVHTYDADTQPLYGDEVL